MSFGTVQAEKMTTESGYSLGAGNASSFKNRIINGGMTISQRNGTTATLITADNQYGLDRFTYRTNLTSKFTSTQSTNAPAGFYNSNQTTVTTSATPASGEYASLKHSIEGYNITDLAFGTANAKPITLSFWVYSSVVGTYGGRLCNESLSQTYVFQYTVNVANTWEQKTISAVGSTTGTWNSTTAIGLAVQFDLGSGTAFQTSTLNAWQNADAIRAAGNVQLITNSGANWYVTGIQIEVGTVATSFDFRSYTTELQLCQRYCLVWDIAVSPTRMFGWNNTTTVGVVNVPIPVTLRSPPTSVTVTNASTMTYYASGVSYTVTAVSLDSSTGINTANLVVTTVGTLSVGAGSILALQSTGNKIILNGMEL
jgi:hypothetical protein